MTAKPPATMVPTPPAGVASKVRLPLARCSALGWHLVVALQTTNCVVASRTVNCDSAATCRVLQNEQIALQRITRTAPQTRPQRRAHTGASRPTSPPPFVGGGGGQGPPPLDGPIPLGGGGGWGRRATGTYIYIYIYYGFGTCKLCYIESISTQREGLKWTAPPAPDLRFASEACACACQAQTPPPGLLTTSGVRGPPCDPQPRGKTGWALVFD